MTARVGDKGRLAEPDKQEKSGGAERPSGKPQPASPGHKQPADVPGESLTTPETQPARDPNSKGGGG